MDKPETQSAVGSTRLLCCPWCGDPPKFKNGKVKCTNIMCKVQPKTKAWYAKGYDQNAIDDWNSIQQPNGLHERPGATTRKDTNAK